VAKLTALWALSEGGLGGILHATRLPFRGVLLACIAAIVMCLIARASRKRTAPLRAAMVVLAIKAVLAPHSFGGAYVAVLNQALMGTVCLAVLGPTLWGCMVVGALALTETSLHHLFWATLLGGAEFWSSLDQLLVRSQTWMVGKVVIPDPARWMVVIYVGIHVAFGLVAGFIAWRLPRIAARIVASAPRITPPDPESSGPPTIPKPKKRKRRWTKSARGMIFILAVIGMAGPGLAAGGYGPGYWRVAIAAVRLICVVALFVFIIRPLTGRLVDRLVRRRRGQSQFADTLASVEALQSEAVAIWRASNEVPVHRRLIRCVAVLFATALIPEDQAGVRAERTE